MGREKVSGLNWYAVMGPSLCTWYAPPRRSVETAASQGMQNSPICTQLGLSCTRSTTHGRVTVSTAPGASSTTRGAVSEPPVRVARTG